MTEWRGWKPHDLLSSASRRIGWNGEMVKSRCRRTCVVVTVICSVEQDRKTVLRAVSGYVFDFLSGVWLCI